MSSIDEHTNDQIARANSSGRTPVVFIRGLWLLASSWDRWGVVLLSDTRGGEARVSGRR
jgi:hypothetical protein